MNSIRKSYVILCTHYIGFLEATGSKNPVWNRQLLLQKRTFLILYPSLENSITGIAIMYILHTSIYERPQGSLF